MLWQRDTTHCKLLPNQSSFVVHDVRDVTGKEALLTATITERPSQQVNKKSNMLVFL